MPEIFVGGLPSSVTAAELQISFSVFGQLKSLRLMRYRDGLSRGFAFITFADWSTTQRVIDQKFHFMAGKHIECKLALDKEQARINIEHEVQRRIFVGNLTPEITAQDLYSYFSYFGTVSNVKIATTIKSDEPKVFAFIIFGNSHSADQVLNHPDKLCLKGVILYCNSAFPKTLIGEKRFHVNSETLKNHHCDFLLESQRRRQSHI